MSEPKITETTNASTMTCAVEVHIEAGPEIVWDLVWNPREAWRWRTQVPGSKRTLVLKAAADRSTDLAMTERYSGPAFALTKDFWPDLKPIFAAYANALKGEAERIERAHHVLNERSAGQVS